MKTVARVAVVLIALSAAGPAVAQEPPPPTPTPAATGTAPEAPDAAEAATKEKIAFRPIESNVIINLPSVEVPAAGTLTFLVTHRFTTALQDGDIDNFFTLDSGNEWGFGLWYAPVKNLNIGAYRANLQNSVDIYEASAEYEFPRLGGFAASLRAGGDFRTDTLAATPKNSFFAQAILAYDIGKYARISAVPTYLQRTNGGFFTYNAPPPAHDRSCTALPPPDDPNASQQFICSGLYGPVWNVPIGVSIALTHSITVHGEVIPSLSRVDSSGVGWSVSVEKSLLRHRFAFFAGNQRFTTVDQYTPAILPSQTPRNVYIGFNLYRAWKLN
jgi:hypothetical protein